jgi:hypothetical protein
MPGLTTYPTSVVQPMIMMPPIPSPTNSALDQMYTLARRLPRIPAHAAPAVPCYWACTTHLRRVDRRGPTQQRLYALHVSVLAGDMQWREPARLEQHGTQSTHNAVLQGPTAYPTSVLQPMIMMPPSPHTRLGLYHRPKPTPCRIPARPTSYASMHTGSHASPRTRAPTVSCHRPCTTNLCLIDRCAPAQQRPHAFHVPILGGQKQRRGPARLSHNTE